MYESCLSGKQAACTWGEDLGLLISEMKRIALVVEVEKGGRPPDGRLRWVGMELPPAHWRPMLRMCSVWAVPAEAPSASEQQLLRKGESLRLDPWVFCFALLLLFIALLKGPGREVTRLLTTLVALCVSVMKG